MSMPPDKYMEPLDCIKYFVKNFIKPHQLMGSIDDDLSIIRNDPYMQEAVKLIQEEDDYFDSFYRTTRWAVTKANWDYFENCLI